MSNAAIVLCGGRSRRMGRDKAALPFGGESMLERVVRIVRPVVDEVILVAREGQQVVGGFRDIVRDPAEGLGPLAGLAAGLAAMKSERAFLTSCDVPLLRPEYVTRLFELSDGRQAAVPHIGGYYMTTSAVYARSVLPVAERLLAQRRLRPFFLVEEVDARLVTADDLRDADPELLSFRNCNEPGDYEAALRDAGFA
jgi:molybdopterin-guanine dinucleotide biosynthesis protein A